MGIQDRDYFIQDQARRIEMIERNGWQPPVPPRLFLPRMSSSARVAAKGWGRLGGQVFVVLCCAAIALMFITYLLKR
jgi:hypothetical protein